MANKVTIAALQQMKRDGEKIVGVVAWDTPMATLADLPASIWFRSAIPSALICGAIATRCK